MMKLITIAVIVLAISSAGAFALHGVAKYFDEKDGISTYEDCLIAGYPSTESAPPRCMDNEGHIFVQKSPFQN